MSETRLFELTKVEIEALLRWHIIDNECADHDAIDSLHDAFDDMGGGVIELTGAGEEALDIDGRLVAVEEAVERDFEDQYPLHWKMLFDHGNIIDYLLKRVHMLESRCVSVPNNIHGVGGAPPPARPVGWDQYQGTGYQGYIR